MEEFPEEPFIGDDGEMTREEMIGMLGDFISQSRDAETVYRNHLCGILVGRIFDEFGADGLCELMVQIDNKAGWISDIIFDQADFNNAMFKRYGTFDDEVVNKARRSERLIEMNQKIWRLRRRYANLIADEIMKDSDSNESVSEDKK